MVTGSRARGGVCEREEEMEELVLGTLPPSRAAAARGHLETCAACAGAHRLFAEERALFARRAATIAAPPPPSALDRAVARAIPTPLLRSVRSRRDLWSVTRVVAAALACAAAIVCVFRDPSTTAAPETIGHRDSEGVEQEPSATHRASARASLPTAEDGLACAYPASGLSRRSLASIVPPPRAMAFASNDVGVCEESPAVSSGP